ncbi:2-oxoacid:acceptor oxidoreductase subunit alpha [bacterium]|nr:2-oxoacid:acceptor oxidoreductase subunit alpha [bacterium]
MGVNDFKSEVDFTVRIGGEGGDGVISCGEMFAQAVARTDYHVFTYISYPAEIRGGYSMIQIRTRDWTIYSMGGAVDYLVVFNQEAYDRSISALREGGTIIYDPDSVTPKKESGATLCPIAFTKISTEISGGKLGKNVVALGVLGELFDIERSFLEKLLQDRFGLKGGEVVQKNIGVLTAGYDAGRKQKMDKRFRLSKGDAKTRYMMLSGNEAVALGTIAAGCRFVAGYPITPATPIFETLCKIMPKVGGKAIQMEDEIASISAIIGASFAGEKTITPTSGPGLQLMGEQLNLASMLELPMVIVDVQRGGPSTGLPTKTEQSDLKFAIYGTAGEVPRVILAPTSVEDSFYQTIRAFNIAELYQMPVILLTDQSIGYRKATVRIPEFDGIQEILSDVPSERIAIPRADRIDIVSRKVAGEDELAGYKRFRITEDGVSPITRPGTPGGQYLATGLEHDESGKADYTPDNHLKMTVKRFRKLEMLAQAFEANPADYYGEKCSKIGVIGWGSTEGAIREARYMAEKEGIYIRHLHPRVISPLPDKQIRRFLSGLDQVIVVEENYTGQFAHFIKAKFGIRPIEVHKCKGVPITPQEIFASIQKVARIVDEEHITEL